MRDIETTDPSKDACEAIDSYLQRLQNLEYELNSQANGMSIKAKGSIESVFFFFSLFIMYNF